MCVCVYAYVYYMSMCVYAWISDFNSFKFMHTDVIYKYIYTIVHWCMSIAIMC